MKKLRLTKNARSKFDVLIRKCRAFASRHDLAIGGLEMIAGAAILKMAIASGDLPLGKDLVGFNDGNRWGSSLGLSGTALGILGGIGIAAGGGAVGVPAAVLAGGGALISTAIGYSLGDVVANVLATTPLEMLAATSLSALGIALLVDGARRVLKAKALARIGTKVRAGVIYLANQAHGRIVKSLAHLKQLTQKLTRRVRQASRTFIGYCRAIHQWSQSQLFGSFA